MIDDGTRSGRSRSDFDVPVGNAQFGPFSVPNATRVHMQAKFDKRAGDGEAVLRTLEFVPSNPMALGPLVFNRMTMDSKGAIHLKLNLKLLKMNFWPQELTIEKIYKDRDGNLVFKMDGSGLAGAFVPDIRIRPDGTVQRFKRGFLGIGRGWKNFKVDGEVFKLDGTLPIDRWPPRATDIMDWLPQEGDPEEEPEPGVPRCWPRSRSPK